MRVELKWADETSSKGRIFRLKFNSIEEAREKYAELEKKHTIRKAYITRFDGWTEYTYETLKKEVNEKE